MDPRIWRNLPQPLFDRVLSFLPPSSFFRFRCVSKRLYSLLFSPSFLDLHHLLSPHSLLPSFLFFPSPSPSPSFAFLFTPSSSQWHSLPLPPLPSSFSPSASSSGLLSFLSDSPGPKTILLLNPLSKLTAYLPSTLRPRLLPSLGLAASDSSLSLIIAGDDMISPYAVKNLTSEAFHADGVTGFYSPWATLSSLPRLCSPEPSRIVYASGRFYCMSCSPFSVIRYDVSGNEWVTVQPPMRRFLRSPSVFVLGGRLMMAATVEKKKLAVPKSMRIWEAVAGPAAAGTNWVEVERMPGEVYEEFEVVEDGRGFECVGSGEYDVAVTVRGCWNVMMFDMRRREWRWAPHCPFVVPAGGGGGGLKGFGYETRLATPAVGLIDSSDIWRLS